MVHFLWRNQLFSRFFSVDICVVLVAVRRFLFCMSFVKVFFFCCWSSSTSLKQQNDYTQRDSLSVWERQCTISCFVIEIYLFIYAFLSFHPYTLFTQFSFKGMHQAFWSNPMAIFVLGGENTNAKIIHWEIYCKSPLSLPQYCLTFNINNNPKS